jgi:hypothetical protein
MDERIARLSLLFETLTTCVKQLEAAEITVDARAYKFGMNYLGQFLESLGGKNFEMEPELVARWIEIAPLNCLALLDKTSSQRSITVDDLRFLFDCPDGPVRPDPELQRRRR